jgi:hypothetical protein
VNIPREAENAQIRLMQAVRYAISHGATDRDIRMAVEATLEERKAYADVPGGAA